MAVLREVKYLEQRGVENIPESAARIYEKNDTFRDYINNLDLTVKWYNKVRDLVTLSTALQREFFVTSLELFFLAFHISVRST